VRVRVRVRVKGEGEGGDGHREEHVLHIVETRVLEAVGDELHALLLGHLG
jgi:hypothetical protein